MNLDAYEGERELWEMEAAGVTQQFHDFEQADLGSNDRVQGRWYRRDWSTLPVSNGYSDSPGEF